MKSSSLLAGAALVLCALLGCNPQNGATIAEIGPGSLCTNGGVIVTSGGTSHTICNGTDGTNGVDGGNGATGTNGVDGGNGTSGFNTLIRTVALPLGDAHCTSGGEEVQTGLDDGANGATPRDGALEAGEVLTTSYLCNGSNSGYQVGSTTPPPGAAAGYTIRARGGDGVDGGAGSAGQIRAQISNGTQGGHVAVFNTGAADPSFSFPALPAFDPGALPAVISKNTTIGGYSGVLAQGDVFINGGELYVVTDSVDGGSAPATSLTIAAGAIVNVTHESSDESPNAPDRLSVQGPIVNAGEITTPPGLGGLLFIQAHNYFGAAGSSLVNNGADGASVASRSNGGPVGSAGGVDSGGIYLGAGTLWNHGAISANGGAGARGGNAGTISLSSTGNGGVPLFNSGAVSARGGVATNGTGGNGATIALYGTGDLDNSGAIDTRGGDGTFGGGSAGAIYLDAAQSNGGSLRNSGSLNASGGGGCTVANEGTCTGGNGSGINLFSQNGIFSSNASISATGGSVGTSTVGGVGGNGGNVNLFSSDSGAAYTSGSSYQLASGDLNLSGSIDVSGGAGWTGGSAGNFTVSLDPKGQPNGQQVLLYGYATLDASGGKGTSGGGPGGQIILVNSQYSPPGNNARALAGTGLPAPGGSVLNYADCFARGGAGGALAGGPGGNVTLQTGTDATFADDNFENVVSRATLDASSGDGASGGSNPNGGIGVNALTGVTLGGHLLARGGAGTGVSPAGPGGAGGVLNVGTAQGELNLSAAGDFSGGNATGVAGSAGAAYLSGERVIFSGQLTAAGGSGTAAHASAGNGGEVQLVSTGGAATQITAPAPASISVGSGTPGAGGSQGSAGQVIVDGFSVTSAWTH